MLSRLRSSFSIIFKRTIFTTSPANNSYEQWPYNKFRRTGRKPSAWKGQQGRRSRLAYDKRYSLSGKDINDTMEGLVRGGNSHMYNMIGENRSRNNTSVMKYFDYEKNQDVTDVVPEMIPDLIVPDLENFKLKPYVSYRVSEEIRSQPKHTAANLFKETYLPDLVKTHGKSSS